MITDGWTQRRGALLWLKKTMEQCRIAQAPSEIIAFRRFKSSIDGYNPKKCDKY
jgi:hypothetical protein